MPERVPNHKFHRWLLSAMRYEAQWRHDNQQCYEYYDGDQWTPEERLDIEARGQQPTVINTIQPTVDMIRSIEVDRRADFQVVGREESDDSMAQLLTALLKQVFDVCNLDYYQSEAFREALIGGRGWLECSVHPDENGRDQIKIAQIPWEQIYLDPFSREPDGSDAAFLIRVKWVDRNVCKALFPEAADLIDSVFDDDYHGQEYAAQMDAGERGDDWYYDVKAQRVKICECFYMVPEMKTVQVMDEETGKKKGRRIFVRTLHHVIFSDEIILKGSAENDAANEDPTGINMYPFVPVHCTRERNGRPRGVVKGLVSIQDQLNKLNSKFLWQMAVNRLIAEEGAVQNLDEAHEEMQKPDGMVILNEGGLAKVRVDDKYRDLSYMSNHLSFLLATEQRISGVNDSMLGLGSQGERSGTMQATRISQGAAMQATVLENLYFARQRVAQVCLRLMGRHYTDYRVLRITQPNGMTDEYKFNWRVVGEDGQERILNRIEDTLEYDVIMKKVPPFTSVRERTLQMFSEVMKTGVIPPPVAVKILLSLADIPGKQDLMLEVENFYKEQQAAAQAAQGAVPQQPPAAQAIPG